jgi:hypothetical protein
LRSPGSATEPEYSANMYSARSDTPKQPRAQSDGPTPTRTRPLLRPNWPARRGLRSGACPSRGDGVSRPYFPRKPVPVRSRYSARYSRSAIAAHARHSAQRQPSRRYPVRVPCCDGATSSLMHAPQRRRSAGALSEYVGSSRRRVGVHREERRRVPPTPQVGGWMVRRSRQARPGPEHHPTRSATHACVPLDQRRVKVLVLQRRPGHTSAKVTLDTYGDLFDEDVDAVAVSLHSRYSHSGVVTG